MTSTPKATKPKRENRALAQDPRKLRWRRTAAGLSLRQLQEAHGMNPATVSLLENGHKSARIATLAKLAEAYGCDITDLMPDEPSGIAA